MASDSIHIPPTGVTAELYRAAIGPRGQDYYLRHFAKFDANGKTSASWHWPAYWSTLNWLVYRRMWGWALAYVAAVMGLALVIFGVGKLIFNYSDTTGLLLFMMFLTGAFVMPGLYGNAWFYTYCNEKISSVLRNTHEIKDACAALNQQASSNRRWFTLASVNVAMLALLAGVVTFVMHPGQDSQQLAQARQIRGTADQMIIVPQPVLASATPLRPEPVPEPVQPLAPEPKEPAAAVVTPPPAPVVAEVPGKSADLPVAVAKTQSPQDTPSQPAVAQAARQAPSAELPKPVLVAAANTEEPAAGGSDATPAPARKAKPKAPKVKHIWLVQVGAFAQESNAQNVRAKVEENGMQTTAEAFDAPAGHLTRVRVGPFDTKADAEKAALRLKALDLPTVLIRQ